MLRRRHWPCPFQLTTRVPQENIRKVVKTPLSQHPWHEWEMAKTLSSWAVTRQCLRQSH
ncbi:hypothetical protein CGLO_16341 [Colletotrichum gloeosporioides Cg-14]|uniref:Uncharacterized protein n=1 Tax=Colletotrichum gloeosporioides (strain Cg-14) TaxID=1237896 RepID=T0KZW3_COLGC|nr:hypothetical protein CGLO_16341 [Colletotrichum gloeosporioides Cg-14]